MDELSAHKYLEKNFRTDDNNILLGIGDDCAVFQTGAGKVSLATNDVLVENTHFIKSKITPRQIGEKSVLVSVSDIAAMGGVPKFIISSLGLGNENESGQFEEIFQGIKNVCSEFELSLIGGNLSASRTIFIDITIIGEIDQENIVKRSNASPGDQIFVTGNIGDSALGFKILEKNNYFTSDNPLVERHYRPSPRVETGKILAREKIPSAMIDISDGLYIDLARITTRFNLGANVDLARLPLSDAYLGSYSEFTSDIHELAVTGGEDYELLFTSDPANESRIYEIAANTGINISRIGTVTENQSISFICEDGEEKSFASKGYIHFN